MIRPQHPNPVCNQQQAAFMASCPEQHRRFHELLFTYGNIAYRYHSEALRFTPTEQDWNDYLEGCPEGFRQVMEKKGFEQGRRTLHFTRYFNEKNDVGMDQYIRQHMSPQDYREYSALVKHGPTGKPASKPGKRSARGKRMAG